MTLEPNAPILICDDDAHVVHQVVQALYSLGYNNVTATSCYEEACLALQKSVQYKMAIVDIRMPENGGTNLIQFIKSSEKVNHINLQVVVMVGLLNQVETNFLADLNLELLISKPFSEKDLASVLSEAFPELTHPVSQEVESYEQLIRIVSLSIRLGLELNISEEHVYRHLAKDPSNSRLQILLAEIKFAQKNIEISEAITRNVLSLSKSYIPAMNLMAKLQVYKGNYSTALDFLESAQLLSPLNTQRLLAIAELHLGHNRYTAAEEKFKKALALNPNLKAAKIGLARAYLEHGHVEGEKIIKEISDPNIIAGELNLKAVLLAKSGHYNKAIAIYNKALSCALSDKHELLITYNIALAHYKKGENVRANSIIEKALLINPDFQKAIRLKKNLLLKKPYSPKEEKQETSSHFFTDDQVAFLMGHKNNISIEMQETEDVVFYGKSQTQKSNSTQGNEIHKISYTDNERKTTDYKAEHARNKEITRRLNKKIN